MSIFVGTLLAAVLIWRLSCIVRARPMGMIVSLHVVIDLLATAISALSAGISIHYVLNYDETFTELVLLPALISAVMLAIGFVAANERRRRGGEIYVHA